MEHKEYKYFTVEDFVKDDFFLQWVKGEPEADWFWRSFMKEYPYKVTAIEDAKKIVASIPFKKDDLSRETFDSMRTHLIMDIRLQKESTKQRSPIQYIGSLNKFWMRLAATLALLIISILIYEKFSVTQSVVITSNEYSPKLEQRENPKGQKSILLLADGTKIWLNADSKLTYAKNFEAGVTREVCLQGEAFFEVAPNPDKPFIVHTSELDIRVLGTSFNVKSYDEDKKIETTLLKGQIKINKANESSEDTGLILAPNQKATFQKETKTMDVEQVQAEHSSSWREDELVFDETTYREVINQLERWYNVNITVEGENNLDCKLTARIEKESLEEVLNLLVLSHKISYTISGSNVRIKGNLCE
jgi:transmembrane sensor